MTVTTRPFDPVLCELGIRWFCPPGGVVFDPFAGGTTCGIVASVLSRKFIGIDISPDRVADNERRAKKVLGSGLDQPTWIAGDSTRLDEILHPEGRFDLVISSPPYADLEQYSEDERDLSTMDFDEFFAALEVVMAACAKRMNDNRFAFIEIGDARDSEGKLYALPQRMVPLMRRHGLELFDDAVMATAVSSLPVRARGPFEKSRKLGRCHQYIQVYCKGDPVKAALDIGDVQAGYIEGRDRDRDTGPDPVLCELMTRWFCPRGGGIIDPLGGEMQRNVAAYLGRKTVGDRGNGDFMFLTPGPRALDAETIERAAHRLRDDRFACAVVTDARGPNGMLQGLPTHAVEVFEAAGLRLYNDAVLIEQYTTPAADARQQFDKRRALVPCHQHVLIFVKGDPTIATLAVGPVEHVDLGEAEEEDEREPEMAE